MDDWITQLKYSATTYNASVMQQEALLQSYPHPVLGSYITAFQLKNNVINIIRFFRQ